MKPIRWTVQLKIKPTLGYGRLGSQLIKIEDYYVVGNL